MDRGRRGGRKTLGYHVQDDDASGAAAEERTYNGKSDLFPSCFPKNYVDKHDSVWERRGGKEHQSPMGILNFLILFYQRTCC